MGHDVFVSHSSIDKSIADAVTAALEQAQIRCWIAPRDILPGESWGGSIVDAIEASEVMVIVFSSNSNDSKQVMREVERAVQKDVIVVPFRVEAVEPSRDMEYFLSATHWLDAVTPQMDDHLKDLVKTVEALLSKSSEQTNQPISNPRPNAVDVASHHAPTLSKKKSWKLWAALAAIVGISVLGLLMFTGDEKNSTTANKDSAAQTSAKDLGERKQGSIKLKFNKKVAAAEKLKIAWSGKSASNDRLVVAKPDAQDSVALQYTSVGDSDNGELQMPGIPGRYEVRYQNGANRKVIARAMVEVELPSVTLNLTDQPLPGGELSVGWQAPNNKYDFIAIAEKSSEGKTYVTYSYTKAGSPTKIRVPDVAGDYELRYISALDKAVWASKKITVPDAQVSFELPDKVNAGTHLNVAWKGPANKGDYLSVASPGAKGKDYVYYVYVRKGQQASLKMPEQSGEYEVRYISGLSKQVWGKKAVTVSVSPVSLSTPETVPAGHEIEITWQGPANKRDYVSVAELGSKSNQYLQYKYVRANQPAELVMPDRPGDYEIRYVSGGENNIWAKQLITITKREEVLSVPDTAKAGSKFSFGWQNPGHGREYVAIYKEGADVKDYKTYAYTKGKTTASIKAPTEPGRYELRYISGQDKLVWARAVISLE